MSDQEIILFGRVFVLFIGALICWLGGKKGFSFFKKMPRSEMRHFVMVLSTSVILLGLTMALIAIGNLMFTYIKDDWTYIFLVSAGLVGIASIAMFIYSFTSIYRYVVIK